MDMLLIGLLGGAVLIYFLYMRVIKIKNTAREAASGIQVQLQLRRDLIPNVLTIAKKYMDHEKSLLTELTELRSRIGAGSHGTDAASMKSDLSLDQVIGATMGRFFAVAENYPDLKSEKALIQAQQSYEEVEGHISAARRFYNAAVTDLNNACEIFPSSVIAGMIGVEPLPYFEATEAATKPVNAADYL